MTVDEAHEFAQEKRVGSFFITPSTREQFPDYRIRHYLPDRNGTHRYVAHCEWLARTFTYTQKFPVKGSALYEEVYGIEKA